MRKESASKKDCKRRKHNNIILVIYKSVRFKKSNGFFYFKPGNNPSFQALISVNYEKQMQLFQNTMITFHKKGKLLTPDAAYSKCIAQQRAYYRRLLSSQYLWKFVAFNFNI